MGQTAEIDFEELKRSLVACGQTVGLSLVTKYDTFTKDGARRDEEKQDYSNPEKLSGDELSRVDVALAWIKIRKRTDELFGYSMFSDPSWNILLHMYVNYCRGSTLTLSNACSGADIPPTTALRWLSFLEDRSLIVRTSDPSDKRKTFVSLTSDGIQRMHKAIDGAVEIDREIGIL